MTDGSQTVRALNILAPIEVARVALEVRIVEHKAQLDRQPSSATTKAAA